MARLLIVDDDEAFSEALAETLQGLGHAVVEAGSGTEALEVLPCGKFDAVFLDHRMRGMDGLQTLAALRARMPVLPPVIVLTAYATGGNTIEAMRLGAFDHLSKPVSREAVVNVLERALRSEKPASAPAQALVGDDGLIGSSPAMREVHKRIGLAAASSSPVLLLGETGTGKEMVARALHRYSDRATGPFVAINCSAIPAELLESELFGHVRGAFTGATADRPGCFRAAHGGVLMLDEIGDMALGVQSKILRALQEGEVTPIGSHQTVKVNVRVVAATHRDLEAAILDGSFREDLYFRLNVLSIRLPPLRERQQDIVPLAGYFLRLAAATAAPKALSAPAEQWLETRAWPGNVRELRNLMERCHALVRHGVIGVSDLAGNEASGSVAPLQPGTALPAGWQDDALPVAVEKLERLLIAHVLAQTAGNRTEAARRLGIHRQLLYRKLEQYGIG
ncbi:MAG: sigma-54-dependent Fis family transcriptional regulator [Comamonadaceae bacterium]|nr:MAG: sigma-54-dependent Fis family transcriptional regulator [Comamonadaceae bacterium]